MRPGAAGLVMALALVPLAACVAPDAPAKTAARQCTVTEVVDGDTVGLACNGGPATLVRLNGVDAPEIARANCPAETAQGEAARRALEGLVARGPVTDVRYFGTHPDGRRLVRLEIGSQDAGAYMVAAGMARRFAGDVYPDWCKRP